MNATTQLEYLCPNCTSINLLERELVVDMHSEQTAYCSQCSTKLEIVPANGLENAINLIVSIADDVSTG